MLHATSADYVPIDPWSRGQLGTSGSRCGGADVTDVAQQDPEAILTSGTETGQLSAHSLLLGVKLRESIDRHASVSQCDFCVSITLRDHLHYRHR